MAAKAGDGPLRLGAPKQRAVLAALLLNANRVVLEDQLITSVWGEDFPPSVRGRLRVYISELRSLVGKALISRVGEGYRITVGPGELDLDVFDQALTSARADLRAGDPDAAARHLRSALALWEGPALAGASEALREREGPALEERRLSAWEELFDAELAVGRHAEVVGKLRQAASDHPFRERLQAQLMLALHRCGRRQEALLVYTEARGRMAEELGIEPGPALREMQVRILNDQDAPPDGNSPAVEIRPAELPRDIQGFAGRDHHLSILDRWWRREPGSVLVISGAAGIGKTALAVRWAHRARDRFPDGQLYLNLRGYEPDHEPLSPAAALAHLLRSLGANPDRLPDGLDERAALYRSVTADRRILVLLDNARDTAQILPLLPSSGTALVTSRHRLGDLVAQLGAQVMSLDVLAADSARALLEGVLGSERVTAESAAAAALAQLCGGLPLALRLAAAHIAASPATTIAQVATELAQGDRLAGLALDGADTDAVSAAFSASYRALAPDNQRLFRLLGLVPGPDFTPAAAAALLGGPVTDAARRLAALAAAHLIEQDTPGRYRFHDLVRLYAAGQARTDPARADAWARLVDHYLSLAAAAARHHGLGSLQLPRDHASTRARHTPSSPAAEADIANLAAALPLAATHGPRPQSWFLADYTRTIFHRTGRRGEWLDIAPTVLDAAERQGEVDVAALLHHSIGDSCFRAGRHRDGARHMSAAVTAAHACGWRECEAAALAELGTALEWTGRLTEATEHTQKAAALFAELGSPIGENRTLNALGGQYHHLGRLHLAEECYRQALALSERHGLARAQATDLMDLGSVVFDLGRIAEADELLERARDLFTDVGSRIGLAWTHVWRSRLRWETEHPQLARDEATAALDLTRHDVTTTLVAAAAHVACADAEIKLARYADAEDHLQQAENAIGNGEFLWHRAVASNAHARLDTRRGDCPSAVTHAHNALTAARKGSYRTVEFAALLALTETYVHWGKQSQATVTGQQALALAKQTGQAGAHRVHSLLAEHPSQTNSEIHR
ncbi:AfsR/SARP family transcriptional regulator [Amycolatopsis anabasis]|uniref:AfsR/SARP family transcriptional regulator n=1 Tax=Amycolatopsis anabasis TaxID=1840409 RepID=UPI001FEAD3EF|nr:BTAD domain-containing putative transcriptional regulator [Amycolatopsis anabasis]